MLAGLINATKTTNARLAQQRFVIMGAGSAAVGCADAITTYLIFNTFVIFLVSLFPWIFSLFLFCFCFDFGRFLNNDEDVPEEEVKQMFWFVDSQGLVTTHRGDELPSFKKKHPKREKEEKREEREEREERGSD